MLGWAVLARVALFWKSALAIRIGGEIMKRFAYFWGVVLAVFLCAQAKAGGPPPVCMTVDKVVFEPNEATPTAVQIWGTFIFLQENKNAYGSPMRGYLYYAVVPGKENECRRHWANLKKLADAGQTICYGRCNESKVEGHVRKPTETPHAPDSFPLAPTEGGFARADQLIDSAMFKYLLPRRSASEKPGDGKR
jgi:hypothetical protein